MFSRIGWQQKSTDLRERLLLLLIMVWSGLALYSYRHVIADLLQQWQTNSSYSHGPIVLPIALWLLWHRRSTLPEVGKPWTAAIGLLLAAHLLLWLGGYFYLPAIARWSIPLWLSGMIGLLWGRRVLRWSLPGVCFLAFMIPVPFQLDMLANQILQWTSAWCGCCLLGLTSTFAVTDGYTLRMATGRVGITADCSGLRMTVAIAALSYVITFLSHRRTGGDRSSGATSHSLALQLIVMMLLVIPAAIVANATRIAVIALVLDRYRMESYTAWAHDLGDWFVLPVSAVLFLIFRAWVGRTLHIWRTEICPFWFRHGAANTYRARIVRIIPVLRIAVAPLVLAAMVGGSIWHYHSGRDRIAARMLSAARSYEEKADWACAADCYRELMFLHSSPEQASYRYAWVSRQAANSLADREHVFFQLEAILERTPFQIAVLRMHLDLALELDRAAAAVRSAERLYAIDRHDSVTLQMCVEAMLRFPSDSSGLPGISAASLSKLAQELGPVSQWRDDLVVEVAVFCCDHPDSLDSRLTNAVGSAIADVACHRGSAKSQFACWDFERVFGTGAESLEPALICIDNECPKQVAYKIYLASAQQAWLGEKPDDAKQFLKKAIDLVPTDHRAFVLLGDVYEAQREWSASTAAYLRAWRLAGDRPLELGIKLAESLIRIERHSSSSNLVKTLVDHVSHAAITPSRTLRIRLQLVQSRLDIRAARHDQALQTLENCRVLATLNGRPSATADKFLPTIEALQAQCLVRLGRYVDVARLFEDRAARVDSPADQWTAAARAWRTAGNATAADRCYRNAVFKVECYSEVWLEYVRFLKDTCGIDQAVGEVALRHSRVHQGPPIADEVLAQAWEIVGRSDLAIQHYCSAARYDNRDVGALAIALARQGEVERAVKLLTDERWSVSTPVRAYTAAIVGVSSVNLPTASKATIMQVIEDGVPAISDDVSLLLAAAEWYTTCQATSAAMELLQRAVTLQPENVVAANNLAMLLADERCDFEQALGCIDNVLKRAGPVSEVLDTKGWILVQMNRAEEALPWLTKAAERSFSADPVAQLHLAAAYLAIGDRDQARQFLQSAQSGPIRHELLNTSERRAWETLQKEFAKQAPTQPDSDA